MVNGSSNAASGLRWHDKDGIEQWMTGDMLLRHLRDMIDAKAKTQHKEIEELAYHAGRKDGELRSQIAELRAEVERLRAELDETRKPPRIVGGRDAA